ncbi:MAG: glycosyltransferase [Chitinophagales bacterium]|nr:glycosyltransferase [Chitinophagales bacterium]
MSFFSLPSWIHPHLFPGKTYANLSLEEKAALKSALSRFNHPEPLISVMIPAWNEQDNIFRTLSSLSVNKTDDPVEIVIINNNSSDQTAQLLEELGVQSCFQPEQGIMYAREMGLAVAKGKYHLCADSDTLYPPDWIRLMVAPMKDNTEITGVYGRYAFMPPPGTGRWSLWIYEAVTGLLVRIRKKNREHLNMLGFNMGFVTAVGRATGGFKVRAVRKFNNDPNSKDFTLVAEDGQMALNLKTKGRLQMVASSKAVVYTSPRKLEADGGVWPAFWNRLLIHGRNLGEYVTGKYRKDADL